MTKVYLFKIIDNFAGSEFSISMSNKYTDKISRNSSNFLWFKLEEIMKSLFNKDLKKEDIIFNEFGKPIFEDINIKFNISHTDNYGCIGISDSEIGVDIETLIEESKIPLIKEYLKIDNNDASELTRKWVLYESKCKYLGIGLKTKYEDINIACKTCEKTLKLDNVSLFLAISYNDSDKVDIIY